MCVTSFMSIQLEIDFNTCAIRVPQNEHKKPSYYQWINGGFLLWYCSYLSKRLLSTWNIWCHGVANLDQKGINPRFFFQHCSVPIKAYNSRMPKGISITSFYKIKKISRKGINMHLHKCTHTYMYMQRIYYILRQNFKTDTN